MFLEIRNKELFNQAQQYAFEYLENVFERNVYPTQEALEKLSVFDEELPANSSSSKHVLEQLNKFGSPATTATIGGRYFGPGVYTSCKIFSLFQHYSQYLLHKKQYMSKKQSQKLDLF